MSDLEILLDRLKDAQRALIVQAAKIDMLPPDSMLRRVGPMPMVSDEPLMINSAPSSERHEPERSSGTV